MDPLAGLTGSRRNEDIALDMMKFIASTTNYGKTASTSAGFHGGAENKSEDYASNCWSYILAAWRRSTARSNQT